MGVWNPFEETSIPNPERKVKIPQKKLSVKTNRQNQKASQSLIVKNNENKQNKIITGLQNPISVGCKLLC